jgi:lipopolysaccharide transport system ATP-binding protein
VDFAEVEKFLDTPVKRYSSGMYVRLAFAVAAHLEPEILVVDEVLAVGDASFQKKCLGKMEDVADREGRTVIFVSHQMAAIQALCATGILLHQGSVLCAGEMKPVMNTYLDLGAVGPGRSDLSQLSRTGNGKAQFEAVYTVDEFGNETTFFKLGNSLLFCFAIGSHLPINDLSVGFSITDQSGQSIAVIYSEFDNKTFELQGKSLTKNIIAKIDNPSLTPGRYNLSVRMTRHGDEIDWPKGVACSFDIVDAPFYANPGANNGQNCLLCLKPEWLMIKPTTNLQS